MEVSLEDRRDVGALLARALTPHAAKIDALARSLAPEGPGPGVRYLEFVDSLAVPMRRLAWTQRFLGPDEFVALVASGDPGALIYALELLGTLDPEQTVAVASMAVARAPWPLFGQALGRALGRCRSREAFRVLMDHPEIPYLRQGLATCEFADGVDEARDALAKVALESPALNPVERELALPVLSYLLRHAPAEAVARLVSLLEVAGEVGVYAAHALAEREEGRAVLCARLSAAPAGRLLSYAEKRAVRVLLEVDPSTALDALGGPARVASPDERPRLLALLDALRADTFHRPHEPSRGWLAADPRFAALLAPLVRDADRTLATLARDLRAKLPRTTGAAHPATSSTPRPSTRSAVPRGPLRALTDEITAIHARLTKLVAHLKAMGYRFAAPRAVLVPPRTQDLRALARLEKRTTVPPALAHLWRTLGGIDLRGEHPGWPRRAFMGFPGNREPVWITDPLVIAPAASVIADALEASNGPPIALHLAPDPLQKSGYSSVTRTIWLPDTAEDPRLAGASAGEETLVSHLRRALAWGGMPGFETIEPRPDAWLAAARAACAG